MSDHRGPWPAGTPCWVDLMAVDIDRTRRFYGEVLGWDFAPPVAGYAGYQSAVVGGRVVAGLSPAMPGMDDAPPAWSVYLATGDIAATSAAATAAGARTVAAPMQVGTMGWMGRWLDPAGSSVGAWQSGEHTGFELVGVDGSAAWCELMSPDYRAALDFYGAVFGLTYQQTPAPEGQSYSMFSVPGGERPAGGIGSTSDPTVAGWSVCFEYQDLDAVGSRVPAAGGALIRAPFDFEFGRLLVASGPDGERFSVMSPAAGTE